MEGNLRTDLQQPEVPAPSPAFRQDAPPSNDTNNPSFRQDVPPNSNEIDGMPDNKDPVAPEKVASNDDLMKQYNEVNGVEQTGPNTNPNFKEKDSVITNVPSL